MSANDVINRALDEIGARATVTNYLTDTNQAGRVARRWYDVSRQRLLRAAPWGFSRRTVTLTELARAADDPDLVPYPWLVKYDYPADCLKMRYLIPPPYPAQDGIVPPDVTGGPLVPWGGPSRSFRFLPSFDPTDLVNPKFLLANILDAYGVYTADVTDDTIWDVLFTNAMEALLAYHFVMPLTGNAGMKAGYAELAKAAVMEARAVDGNEAIPTTDHTPDWIAVRNGGGAYGYGVGGVVVDGVNWGGMGMWYDAYDLNWGM